jgi:NAD(P)-dependent dehydrogenase (short-subunit alcohol dehydrogenase family)
MDLNKPFDLKDKIALVTGASRGIGEGIAKIFAAHGAHVIVSSRKQDACEAVAEAIRAAGGEATAMACHIGELEQITHLYQQIRQRFNRLDILVNNAAANPFFGHILETDLGAYQKTVDVNIRGYFFSTIEAGKIMRDNGGGSILNVASINGINPGAYQGIYSITKGAIITMTKSFAKELAGEKIRVNALLPGATDTKFAAALVQNEKILNQLMPHVPMQRVAEPDEMAGAALYLVSPSASYTTGSCLTVDGGYLIG